MLDYYNFNRTKKLNLKKPHSLRGLELIKFMFLGDKIDYKIIHNAFLIQLS